MRSFIALELSAEVQQALAAVQSDLRSQMPHACWTKPQGTHLTLKFLGDVRPEQVGAITAGLDAVVVRHRPFVLVLAGVGAFPRLAAPRVLWVGVSSSEELLGLQRDVETAIAPLGFPSEHREFKAHLTLARLNGDNWPPDLRQHFLSCTKLVSGVSWQAERLVLFRSDLQKGGAVYTPAHIGPLTRA